MTEEELFQNRKKERFVTQIFQDMKTFFRKLVHRTSVHQKSVHRTSGDNFTNNLRTTFTLVDPESVKKIQLSHKYLFTLFGSANIKAVRRTLMKLSPVHRKSVHLKSVHRKFVHRKSVHWKPFQQRSVHRKSVHRKSVHKNSVHKNSVCRKTVHEIPVHRKSWITFSRNHVYNQIWIVLK